MLSKYKNLLSKYKYTFKLHKYTFKEQKFTLEVQKYTVEKKPKNKVVESAICYLVQLIYLHCLGSMLVSFLSNPLGA